MIRQCAGQQVRFASRRASKAKAKKLQHVVVETPKREAPISPFIASLLTPTTVRQSIVSASRTAAVAAATTTTTSSAEAEQERAAPLLIQHHITPDEYKLATSDLATAINSSPTAWAGEKEHVEQQAEHVRRIIGLETANAKELVRWNVRQAVDKFSRGEADTGSPEVQAAIWTVRIRNLERHLGEHRKDTHNRRTYRHLVHKRAKILRYLKRESLERYHVCLKHLSLLPEQVEGEIVVA